jgi:hypothetical protein
MQCASSVGVGCVSFMALSSLLPLPPPPAFFSPGIGSSSCHVGFQGLRDSSLPSSSFHSLAPHLLPSPSSNVAMFTVWMCTCRVASRVQVCRIPGHWITDCPQVLKENAERHAAMGGRGAGAPLLGPQPGSNLNANGMPVGTKEDCWSDHTRCACHSLTICQRDYFALV